MREMLRSTLNVLLTVIRLVVALPLIALLLITGTCACILLVLSVLLSHLVNKLLNTNHLVPPPFLLPHDLNHLCSDKKD